MATIGIRDLDRWYGIFPRYKPKYEHKYKQDVPFFPGVISISQIDSHPHPHPIYVPIPIPVRTQESRQPTPASYITVNYPIEIPPNILRVLPGKFSPCLPVSAERWGSLTEFETHCIESR